MQRDLVVAINPLGGRAQNRGKATKPSLQKTGSRPRGLISTVHDIVNPNRAGLGEVRSRFAQEIPKGIERST